MRTLKLTVSESAYKKLKAIFSSFEEEDLRVEEDIDESSSHKYQAEELQDNASVAEAVHSYKVQEEDEDEDMDFDVDPSLMVTFEEAKKRVAETIARIDRGEEKFYTLEEVEASTEAILKKYGA